MTDKVVLSDAMIGSAQEKVPGGKLARVKVEWNGKIEKVKITGDFFIHPEDSIEKIEGCLSGMPADSSEEEIGRALRNLVKENEIVLIGITEESVARLVRRAMA